MAFTLIAHTGKVTGPSGGTTTAIDTTGATLLFVCITIDGTPNVTDSKGNTWTPLTADGIFFGPSSKAYYCISPIVGSGHTFTIPGNFSTGNVLAFAASGPVTFDAETHSGSGTSTTVQAGSITPARADELFLAQFCASASATAASIDSGFTISDQQPGQGGVNYAGGLAYLISSGSGAQNPTWSGYSNTSRCVGLYAFKEGSVSIGPSGIPSRRAFGGATVTLNSGVLYPTGITSRRAFGTPSMSQDGTVSPSSVVRTRSVGTPVVTFPGLAQTISPTSVPSRRAFGSAGVVSGGTQYLLPTSIISRRRFGFPTVVQVGPFVGPRVFIAGKNFRCAINPEISIQRRMGTRANATFRLMCNPGVSPVRPVVEQSVRITENGRILFQGFLNEVEEECVTATGGLYFWDCQAVDLAVIADRRRVAKIYPPGSFRAIVLDMVANSLSGENITTNNVLTTAVTTAEIVGGNKTFNEVMNAGCAQTGDMWQIDEFGDLHTYQPGNAPASTFAVTATSANLMPGIKKKTSSIGLATQIFIRSNQDLGLTEDLSE